MEEWIVMSGRSLPDLACVCQWSLCLPLNLCSCLRSYEREAGKRGLNPKLWHRSRLGRHDQSRWSNSSSPNTLLVQIWAEKKQSKIKAERKGVGEWVGVAIVWRQCEGKQPVWYGSECTFLCHTRGLDNFHQTTSAKAITTIRTWTIFIGERERESEWKQKTKSKPKIISDKSAHAKRELTANLIVSNTPPQGKVLFCAGE